MGPILKIDSLSKRYAKDGKVTTAIDDLSLDIEEGSFLSVVGPSGCGKSTMLNIMAGLQPASRGQVLFRGEPVEEPSVGLGYLTQKDTLMPWRTVETNVAMPLEIQGMGRAERLQQAHHMLELVGLKGNERYYPGELSGGMLRRASVARLLCGDPDILLMDEPFGALDAQLRITLQNELLRIWSGSQKTVVFVTHDIEEAIVLADTVIVLLAPARIAAVHEVDLSRPRDAARVRFEDRYRELHRQLWDEVMSEQDADVQEATA
jgi:NitT/TauT family transport system ATP-binding protein